MAVDPPPPRPEPLSQLYAVEHVLRLGGYVAAGRDLGLTPGAVREKLRAIERRLGVPLVRTRPRSLDLTPDGEALRAPLSAGFRHLERVLARFGAGNWPLGCLRALEVALRLSSFAMAAAELGMTASAVSGHVRRFEHWAAQRVFARRAQGVRVLGGVADFQSGLAKALSQIDRALQGVGSQTVRIAALPSVAQLWVSRRLPALRAAFAGVRISVTALERVPTGKAAPYDMAVFFEDASGTILAQDALVPVCAPDLAMSVRSVSDIARLPTLGDAVWSSDWQIWAKRAGIEVPHPTLHSLYALAVDEAMAGAGVLMGHKALVAPHLASGTLVALPGPEVPLPRALRLIRLRRLRGAADAVARWLESSGVSLEGPPPRTR